MIKIEKKDTDKLSKDVDLDNYKISLNLIKNINKEIAKKYILFPFKENEKELFVAMSSLNNYEALNDLKFITHKKIVFFKAEKTQIKQYIKMYYEIEDTNEMLQEINIDRLKNDLNLEDKVDSPSVRLVNSIIEQAISKKTSDIHIEPFQNCVYVRFRIDGILHEIRKLPKSVYKSINIRIKIISKMNITLKREPQDGKIDKFKEYENCNFRVSSVPTIYGEKFVIRILYKSAKSMKLEDIAGENSKIIKNIIKKPNGIILLTGPTGSGKSSTAYSILNEFNPVEKNIVTIEDPVEFTMERINQINVNKKSNLTFAAGLKSVLRQDPDIIFVGEIRDEETAKVAVRAAITGHLVISTLHTNDAPGVIPRLRDMGIKSYLLCDALTAAIAQRLVRKICPYCKEAYFPSDFEKRLFNLNENEVLYKGHGCLKCNNTGYSGRIAIFEIMEIDSELKKLIYENKSIEEIKKHCEDSKMASLSKNAKFIVKKGITTTYEYVKSINIEDDSR